MESGELTHDRGPASVREAYRDHTPAQRHTHEYLVSTEGSFGGTRHAKGMCTWYMDMDMDMDMHENHDFDSDNRRRAYTHTRLL